MQSTTFKVDTQSVLMATEAISWVLLMELCRQSLHVPGCIVCESLTQNELEFACVTHPYTQCAAVRIQRDVTMEPPHRCSLLKWRLTCQGNWPGFEMFPPTIRLLYWGLEPHSEDRREQRQSSGGHLKELMQNAVMGWCWQSTTVVCVDWFIVSWSVLRLLATWTSEESNEKHRKFQFMSMKNVNLTAGLQCFRFTLSTHEIKKRWLMTSLGLSWHHQALPVFS